MNVIKLELELSIEEVDSLSKLISISKSKDSGILSLIPKSMLVSNFPFKTTNLIINNESLLSIKEILRSTANEKLDNECVILYGVLSNIINDLMNIDSNFIDDNDVPF